MSTLEAPGKAVSFIWVHQVWQKSSQCFTSRVSCAKAQCPEGDTRVVSPQIGTLSMIVDLGSTVTSLHNQSNMQVVLATVIVNIKNLSGNLVPCRAVLDSGSQLSFITDQCVAALGLKCKGVTLPINGIGQSNTQSCKCCTTVTMFSFNFRCIHYPP